MPITTFQTILSTDKLQSGFRAKINADIALLITDIIDNGDGTATVSLQGGTNFQISLGTSFYTKPQVQALITAVTPAVWGAITGNVENQTDVIGNLGVISPIDAILLSANFAVDATDPDNPFGAFAASGYASFSIPSTTGWQLLIKENNATEIKFRTYSGGVWHAWITIMTSNDPILIPAGSAWPATLVPGVDFITNSLYPIPYQVIQAKTSLGVLIPHKWTSNGTTLVCDYYLDVTDTILQSIAVYTTTEDSVTVDVDTWVRVI